MLFVSLAGSIVFFSGLSFCDTSKILLEEAQYAEYEGTRSLTDTATIYLANFSWYMKYSGTDLYCEGSAMCEVQFHELMQTTGIRKKSIEVFLTRDFIGREQIFSL